MDFRHSDPVVVSRPTLPQVSFETGMSIEITAPFQKLHQKSQFLAISPYTDAESLLELSTLDIQSQLLAQALTELRSLKQDYAVADYLEIFNWTEVAEVLRQLAANSNHEWKEQTFYIVVFRSQIKPTADYGNLGALDHPAFQEAVKSGGFLKYWYGVPDHMGRNLATCIWRSQEEARLGGVGPAHRAAAAAARTSYVDWSIERLALVVKDRGATWEIKDWNEKKH